MVLVKVTKMKYSKSALFCYIIVINVLAIQCLSENDIPSNQEEQGEINLKENEVFNEMIRKIDPEFNQTFECIREKILQNKLDPLHLPIIPLIFKTNSIESNLTVTNFQLHGLSSFEVRDAFLNTVPINLYLQLRYKLENLVVIFKNYNGFVRYTDKFHLYGNGSFVANLTNFDLDVRVNLKLKNWINPLAGVLVRNVTFSMNLFKTKIDITGLFNDPIISKQISEELSKALTEMAAQEKDRIDSFIQAEANLVAEYLINPILLNMNLEEALEMLKTQWCKSNGAYYINRGIEMMQNFVNSQHEFDVEDYLSKVSDYYYHHLN